VREFAWSSGSRDERRDAEKRLREVRREVSLSVGGRAWVERVTDVGCWFGC
jgi:hypothetical protein